MATFVGIGFSQNKDAAMAALEAAEQAKEQLNQSRIDLAVLFNTIQYDPKECLPIIYKILNQTKIIGTSTAAIILSNRIETQGIGIMAIHSEDITLKTSCVSHLDLQDIYSAGKTLAKDSMIDFGQEHRKLFVFFTDGLSHETLSLLEGIKEGLGSTFPILGAGSSDDFHFHKTYQFYKEKFFSRSAVGMLLSGRLHIGIGSRHGFRPLGKPRTADKVEGHIIKSIDGKKATDTFQEYFGEETKALKTGHLSHINFRYPLGILTEKKGEYLLRNVTGTMDDGSIVCKDPVDAGSEIHIMIGNKESCLKATQEAAKEAKAQLQGRPPSFIMIFESFLRYKLLGRDILEEVEIIKNILGSAPLIGMYSYGEILNLPSSKNTVQTQLQNGSISILAIS